MQHSMFNLVLLVFFDYPSYPSYKTHEYLGLFDPTRRRKNLVFRHDYLSTEDGKISINGSDTKIEPTSGYFD
jgi:hypothetical protein